ncbi:hypothetical protein KL918_001763 [Ogataea parapolymorpha]|uniref:Uncharacterized protein n=1 Tax=Ogataea parapolymorpha (strain ATCC 26012 / BCRC 20466 / JCM 22074 / NRRL Y-7560 / DL-1) TaxID=871575 RepID=W1QE41_OGAPD|nr:hypothetical protein HPODL_04451 [Ogataea parapolymorpha DL-1]ESW98845.1 hypothetical protein HPODL_04451 [Ogataea parapolymorpha DL-1]KAG7868105.1 hypothetical protein KL918_001763 [Ogataea parapolymorpha]KAG7874275.1 hypothetical protein KL916_001615 [Ogataea parapolymorpha]
MGQKSSPGILFDPVEHLAFSKSKIPRSTNVHSFHLDPTLNSLELVGEGSFPLFSRECVDLLRQEVEQYSQVVLDKEPENAFTSPKLRDCEQLLPFVYQAWTHPATVHAISVISGFDMKLCLDYEIAHFCRSRNCSQVLVRQKSVAYPYICVMGLNSTDMQSSGYATVLKGRLSENLATKQPQEKDSLTVVLCATLQPENVICYEDTIFLEKCSLPKAQKLISDKEMVPVSNYADFKDFGVYQSWLNDYYDKENHANSINK